MNKTKALIAAAAISVAAALAAGTGVSVTGWNGTDYSIPELDLSVMPEATPEEYRTLYALSTVDSGADYLAHPDSVLLKSGNILTLYPKGHGKGAVLNKISTDGGAT